MLNEDVHIKLVKLYLRQANRMSRAVRHLVKLEYGEYFANSPTWYKNTIDTIENALEATTIKPNEVEEFLLVAVLVVLLSRYVKLQLKTSSTYSNLVDTLLK